MAIPPFDTRGLLPPFIGSDPTTSTRSPYVCTMAELAATLGTTSHRRRLLSGLLSYRALIMTLGYSEGLQFINGSFVENVELREGRDPGDIDVFSFLVLPFHYHTGMPLWLQTGLPEWTSEFADRNKNKIRFGIDAYAIALGPQTDWVTLINATTGPVFSDIKRSATTGRVFANSH